MSTFASVKFAKKVDYEETDSLVREFSEGIEFR